MDYPFTAYCTLRCRVVTGIIEIAAPIERPHEWLVASVYVAAGRCQWRHADFDERRAADVSAKGMECEIGRAWRKSLEEPHETH